MLPAVVEARVKSAKKAVTGLSGACKKEFVRRFISQSICGRADKFEVCCSTKKGGSLCSEQIAEISALSRARTT
jgi:hypothetical protein